jgi:hypothetical protein
MIKSSRVGNVLLTIYRDEDVLVGKRARAIREKQHFPNTLALPLPGYEIS